MQQYKICGEISEIMERKKLISTTPYLQKQSCVYTRSFDFPYRLIPTYLITYLPNPWNRFLLENLTVLS